MCPRELRVEQRLHVLPRHFALQKWLPIIRHELVLRCLWKSTRLQKENTKILDYAPGKTNSLQRGWLNTVGIELKATRDFFYLDDCDDELEYDR